MPITKSAKKSLKVSRTKTVQNKQNEIKFEKALKKASKENINEVISLIDKAAKTGLIHRNKAARLKSRLTKKFGTPVAKREVKTVEKKKAVKGKHKLVKKSETRK